MFRMATWLGLLLLICISYANCHTTPPSTTLPSSSLNASSYGSPSRASPAHSLLDGLADGFPAFPFADDWPSSSAGFERPLSKVDLLALKVDHSLMASLDQWLSKYGIKMPQNVLRTIDEMDLCPERASDGMIREW